MPAAGYHVGVGPSYMRGAVFWEKNKPLTFEDFQMPCPKANEVLIKTKGKLKLGRKIGSESFGELYLGNLIGNILSHFFFIGKIYINIYICAILNFIEE
ncbi:hypothetical protein ACP275_10G179700 [Erythranthe tilingii]